jgi:glutamine---fructose-6-phosphate transaminase (isomerizing)
MCGIFGINISYGSSLSSTEAKKILNETFLLSERRGKDASGLLSISSSNISVLKSPMLASDLLKLKEYNQIVNSSLKNYNNGESFSCMGHTRMTTGGSEEINHNNQPVLKENCALIHNGIIVNERDILNKYDITKEYGVDSEVLISLFTRNLAKGYSHLQSFQESISLVNGANTFALIPANSKNIYLHSSNKSLYLFHDSDLKISMFSSERNVLKSAINSLSKKTKKLNYESMIFSNRNKTYSINIESSELRISDIDLSNKKPSSEYQSTDGKSKRKIIVNHEISYKNISKQKVITNKYREIEGNININYDLINDLKRCSNCVLPSTFPDIFFDEKGICNYCNTYKKIELHSNEKLLIDKKIWEKSDGSNDVLVPLSGGRDSSYGLHYVKNELNLNPIAYTYDWGFVTDQARRNISRMCGEMNVEHILVAADIKTKRNNVSKNVKAWLSNPEISLVPLFMAGDKFFYKYASILQKEMNLSAIIYSLHALEVTNFKTGFANVNERNQQEKLTGLSKTNTFKLMLHYLSKFIKNPNYLNSTIPDTVMAFMYYYIKGRDYYSIFDYIPWEEDKILSVIKNQYGWEGSSDGELSWRIGDGTAPFYNYIYLRHSGFCENDTFRSNQIRESLITREEALKNLKIENRIDPQTYKWYCDTINIDAVEALKKINSSFKINNS